MNARAGRFPLFDSLRAIAALSVLVFHAAFVSLVPNTDSFVRPYTAHLDVGVTVFFLISGFLLYRPFLRGKYSVPAYAWRRFLRIVPAYWVALTVIAIWFGFHETFPAGGEPLYYAFGQIYSGPRAPWGIPQAWTLCVEVTFYAFLPLWALGTRRLGFRQQLLALAGLWVASLAYKVWALEQTSPSNLAAAPYLQPLPNYLDQFAIGMALAVLSVRWEEQGQLPRAVEFVRRHDWIPWLGAVVAFWVVSTRIGFTGKFSQHPSRKMFLGKHELYSLVALGLILPAIFSEPGRGFAGRVLANRVLAYIGLISYGMYLYHLAVIRQVDSWLGAPLDAPLGIRIATYALLGLAGATLIATVSYYVVERPALRLKRLVSPPAPAERGEASEEPATPASTMSATSPGWRNRGTP